MIYMPQLFMYVHVIQRVHMFATLCSHLSGNPVPTASKYKKGVLLASQKAFRWTPYVINNVKVVNLRANANSGVGR